MTRRVATIRSTWDGLTRSPELGGLLSWPPDVFALTDRVLDASEAYRFVVSPPPRAMAPPSPSPDELVASAAEWLDRVDRGGPPPARLASWWTTVVEGADVAIEALGDGDEWELCRALLALHAVADEACAGLGAATAAPPGPGRRFRAMARELLADTGSLSRVPPDVLRVLPRCRTSRGGISIRSLARHVCTSAPRVDVEWHRILLRPTGVTTTGANANVVLLPWPLHVDARDFRPVSFSLPNMDPHAFGFFAFDPPDGLDLALVDGVLRAAEDEAGSVDMVVLPEGSLRYEEIEPLERLLADHGAWCLITGIRGAADDGLTANSVHVGVRQEMVWRHVTQHKHHRWCLDPPQIRQYDLGAALAPTMRWWEAIAIPRRSLQVVDVGAGVTLAPLVCEDLARAEPVSELVRAIAPSLVVTLLLDGPQLATRWTARYASVLADDPGCAVCTLSSYGMVQRCRPPGHAPSSVVALWKDRAGKLREIALDDGAHGVLLRCSVAFAATTTADGRRHPGATEFTLDAAESLRAASSRRRARRPPQLGRTLPVLSERELSKATSWVESLAEAAVSSPGDIDTVLDDASARDWRETLELPRPTRLFDASVAALRAELDVGAATPDLLAAAARLAARDDDASVLTAALVRVALEQRLFTELRAGRRDFDEIARLLDGRDATSTSGPARSA